MNNKQLNQTLGNSCKIEICNLRTSVCRNAWDVRVDRTSVLGNPFYMRDESQRNSVCDEYQFYFDAITTNNWTQLRNFGVSSSEREDFMNELRRLYKLAKQYGKLRLFCWCAPKRCHAETIKRFLEGYLCKESPKQAPAISKPKVEPKPADYRYTKSEVFEYCKYSSGYAKNVYRGKLKPEYVGVLTKTDVAKICDNYSYNFGDNTVLNADGTFVCEIYID